MKKGYKYTARMPEREELNPNPVRMCSEISHIFRAKMRDINEADDTAAQHGTRLVISYLATGDGVTQLDLVKATHLRPPTISVMLKRLEEDGIVERRRDENDLRSMRVYLSEKGREIDCRNIKKIKQVESIALDGLSDEERATAMSLLGRIRDNLLASNNALINSEKAGKTDQE